MLSASFPSPGEDDDNGGTRENSNKTPRPSPPRPHSILLEQSTGSLLPPHRLPMDDDDDFGVLYADLDDQVNAGVYPESGLVVEDSSSDLDDNIVEEEGDDRSDSEDDIRIVLNERDGEGEDGVEERRSRGCGWRSLGDGMQMDGGGGGVESFKYLRSDTAVDNEDAKCIISQSDDMFFSKRRDWELKDDELMKPCSVVAATGDLGVPVATCNGFNFSLPRNRTIFDVSIEAFEWKPWRNNGVDTTDFFNFDLNEESWKSYCEHLENFRRQTTMLTSFPCVGQYSSNQMFESKFLHGAVPAKSMTCEVEGTCTSEIEKQMGRAIQVEGGVGERRPSIDIKRPRRNKDTDVVIQVKMEGYVEDACSPVHQEFEHRGSFYLEPGSKNFEGPTTVNGVCNMLSSDECHQKTEVIDNEGKQKCQGIMSSVTSEALWQLQSQPESSERNVNHPVTVDASVYASESFPSDEVLCKVSPSCFDSDPNSSEDGVSFDEGHSSKLLGTSTGFQESAMSDTSVSKDSTGATNLSEHCSTDGSPDYNCTRNEWKSRRKTQRLSAVKVPVKDDDCSSLHKIKFLKTSSKITKRVRDSDHEANVTSENERDMLSNERKKRFVRKQDNGYSHIQNFEKEDEPGHHIRRNCYRRSYSPYKRATTAKNYKKIDRFSLEQRATFRRYCSKQMGGYIHGRNLNDQDRRAALYEKTYRISEKTPFNLQEDWFTRQRRKIRDDGHPRMKFGFYDDVENDYEEGMTRKRCGRDMLHFLREEGTIQDAYHRNIPCKAREPVKKKKWDHSPGFYLDNFKQHFEEARKFWRHADRKPLVFQTDEEYSTMERRDDEFLLKNHLYNSRQLRENHLAIPSCYTFKDVFSKENTDRDMFSQSRKNHASFNREDICFEKGDYFADEKQRHTSWLGQTNWLDEEVGLKHQVRAGSYSLETPSFSRRSSTCVSNCSMYKLCENGPADGCFLDNYGREIIGEESRIYGREQKDALRCGKGVSRRSGVLEEKLQRRRSKVANKMRKHDIACMIVKSQGDFSSAGKLQLQKDISDTNLRNKNARGDPQRLNVKNNRLQFSSKATRQTTMQWTENNAFSEDPCFSEPEEGQLIEEPEDKDVCAVAKDFVCYEKATCSSMKSNPPKLKGKKLKEEKEMHHNGAASATKLLSEDERILVMLAKMEKRRERFKDPAIRKEPEKSQPHLSDFVPKADETVKERPARKRRWGGNSVVVLKD